MVGFLYVYWLRSQPGPVKPCWDVANIENILLHHIENLCWCLALRDYGPLLLCGSRQQQSNTELVFVATRLSRVQIPSAQRERSEYSPESYHFTSRRPRMPNWRKRSFWGSSIPLLKSMRTFQRPIRRNILSVFFNPDSQAMLQKWNEKKAKAKVVNVCSLIY